MAIVATPASETADSLTCGTCGLRVARRRPSQRAARRSAFCSPACYHASLVGRATHNAGVRTVVSKPCEQCGNQITGARALVARRRFCSRACCGQFHSGAMAPAWRGGVTPARKAAFNSPGYRAWRSAVLARDGGRCRWCDSEGVRTYRPLEVHHIVPVSSDPGRIFDVSNGIALCKEHHDLTRGREEHHADRLAALVGVALTTTPTSSNPTRPPLTVARDVLVGLYWTEGLSARGVAQRLGVTDGCVLKYMRRLGIERRTANGAGA